MNIRSTSSTAASSSRRVFGFRIWGAKYSMNRLAAFGVGAYSVGTAAPAAEPSRRTRAPDVLCCAAIYKVSPTMLYA